MDRIEKALERAKSAKNRKESEDALATDIEESFEDERFEEKTSSERVSVESGAVPDKSSGEKPTDTGSDGWETPAIVKAVGAKAMRRQQKQEIQPIVYRQTRTEEVDPRVLEENRIVAHDKMDPRSIPYDQLRTHLLQVMDENGWKTLAVTSPTEACGKTVTSINLAYSLSHLKDQTVFLVDFDLRRPSVANYLGLQDGYDLATYLNGGAEMDACLVNPSADRLVILPNFHPVENASELLASDSIKEMVRDIRRRYTNRKIIFDLPPILTTDDVQAFLPSVDCVLLVAAMGKTRSAEVEQARSLLARHNLIGAVMNFGELETKSYYGYHTK